MKSFLVFLVLFALVICPPPKFSRETRKQRKQQIQKGIAD
jgi:hypothetical protein